MFHGADRDVLWLQRDFGVYVVNMFDTGLAMRQLEYHKLSLQYLVSIMCNVPLDKHFQRRDWRIRLGCLSVNLLFGNKMCLFHVSDSWTRSFDCLGYGVTSTKQDTS